MARYTQADLEAVQSAIMDLSLGKRVSSVTIAGRTVTYEASAASVMLPQLKILRREIEADLRKQAGTQRSRTRIAVTRKGL